MSESQKIITSINHILLNAGVLYERSCNEWDKNVLESPLPSKCLVLWPILFFKISALGRFFQEKVSHSESILMAMGEIPPIFSLLSMSRGLVPCHASRLHSGAEVVTASEVTVVSSVQPNRHRGVLGNGIIHSSHPLTQPVHCHYCVLWKRAASLLLIEKYWPVLVMYSSVNSGKKSQPKDHIIPVKPVYFYIKCVMWKSFLTLLPKLDIINFNSH